MNKLIAWIEKGKPFFEKISRNIYLRAIRDGFIAAIPIILFSSIFILITYVPNVFGFTWSKTMEGILMKPYNYTMGIVGLSKKRAVNIDMKRFTTLDDMN
ncbi:cellobiose-specific phosphotransferase system component IIC [Staphylococcus hominis]